ncbi:MAG: hypothetical protein D4R84_05565 [Rhodocyclaceae bacterium]|nr:MAG: hypothetical protein D4R84_05565 [Rhodocyclaceae bacterium]
MKTRIHLLYLLPALLLAAESLSTVAASEGEPQTPQSVAMQAAAAGATASPQPDATDLRFHEFFKLPIGPRGLEPTEKLKSLAGKRIRMVGYMARQDTPASGHFVLSPLPVSIGDEDESLADDLPASVVFVHVYPPAKQPLPFYPGLLRVTGTLSLGAHEETDGHVSSVRLQLDPELARAMAAGRTH